MDSVLNILVVDDSENMRLDLKTRYEELGHNVIGEAANGLEALELVESKNPDLVSLDIIMPEMDGIECYRLLKKLESPPRCLLVSALSDEPRVIEAYSSEISGEHYVSKNCTNDELSEKIRIVMEVEALSEPPKDEHHAMT